MEQSQLEIAIQYKSWPARLGLFFFLLTAPVWLLITVATCVFMVPFAAFNPSVQGLSTFLFMLALLFTCLMATIACSDDKLFLSKSGIAFPLFMSPFLGFRRSRSWSDLRSVSISEFNVGKKKVKGKMILSFYSGASARLNLGSMPKDQLEKFFLGVDVWAPHCLKSEQFSALQTNLSIESSGGSAAAIPSYTQLWEEELRRRFFPTAFVPLEAGAKLRNGSVVIVRQLAFGGLSAIYLAQDSKRSLVVVKESVIPLNAEEAAKEKATELFAREATILSKLEHPRISKVLDFFVEDNRQYLVLEQIRGQDTRQVVIEHGAQNETSVIQWAAQIADILKFLHTQNPPIIHRDVTPDNLVLSGGNKIFLIDFGASNEFLGTATGTLVGKQSYISPEQFRGKACPQSDIYAFGATLFYYLTGEEPEPLSTLSLPENISASEEIRSFISRCTAYKLQDRFQSIFEVIAALEAMSVVEMGR